MTKVPKTVDDETHGEPVVRLLTLLHFPTMVVLIVIPLVVVIVIALVLFRDFFTRSCYLTSMVDVISTDDDDDDEVNEQSITMDTYGEATPSSPSRVHDTTTTQTLSPVASGGQSDSINIDMNTYLSLVDYFPSLNESLSDTISECSIDETYV